MDIAQHIARLFIIFKLQKHLKSLIIRERDELKCKEFYQCLLMH